MADILLEKNDEAYARVEEVIDTIAFKLRLRHIKLDQTLAPRNDALGTSGPALIGSVTRVTPHAFGIFAVQDHVHLYCRTTMRLQLFEEHLKEMLGLENLDVNGQDIKITIPHEQLARIGLALPNSLNLVFAHMGFEDFDTLSEGEQLPFSRLAGLLQDPLAALHLSSMYRELYLQVRDWAHRVGIVSPMGCMVTEQDLLKYYTTGFLAHIEDVRGIVSSPMDGYELFYKSVMLPVSTHHLDNS
ncbi:hypothetical protein PRZ48_004683 [Zasmidium cellare]|uniref:Uncharacterized protein n=1 Tax=Zasmidium cellare TaxID=395010 RepID=A0ABR0ESE9_ZASCE|nr:hypothetical protein PRZ48_004683 [Zasmidium cellare]